MSSNLYDENELCKDLGPKATEFVRLRIQQELNTIQKDRDRVIHTMKDQILHMKQCLLYDLCSKMQNIAFADQSNLDIYKEKCPDLFTRFSQKNTKKKARKKPKLQKLNIPVSNLNHSLDISNILLDLACVKRDNVSYKPCDDPLVQMTTNGGQKWIVQKFPGDNNLTKLKYCDGSSSVIPPADVETLNLRFDPIDK